MAENEEKLLFVVPLSLKKFGERNRYLVDPIKKIEDSDNCNYSRIIKEIGEEFDKLDRYEGDEYEEDYSKYSKK